MINENLKLMVSDFIRSEGSDVLEMFFKKPCDECEIIKSWSKFSFNPDLIILKNNNKYLAFIIDLNEYQKTLSFINEHSGFLEYKIYIVEKNNLYELKNIKDKNSKGILVNSLKCLPDTMVGSSQKTFKSLEGKWEENREFGLRGEKEVIKTLNSLRAKIIDLNFNAPCDSCSNIQNWRKYNKLPDGIASLDEKIFFFDAKAKSSRYFKVNERDYVEYQRKFKYLPVKIYFAIFGYDKKHVKEIYIHTVTPDKREATKDKEWDKNNTVDLTNELEQIV